MRVLVISPYLPFVPSTGFPTRVYCLSRALAQSHDFHLVSPPGPAGQSADPRVFTGWSEVTRPDPTGRANDIGWLPAGVAYRLGRLRRVLRRWLSPLPGIAQDMRWLQTAVPKVVQPLLERRSFDLLQIESTFLASLLEDLPLLCPRLIVAHDHVHRIYQRMARERRGWQRLGALCEYWKWYRLETRLFSRPHHFVTMSQEDARHLSQLSPDASVSVVPNGVDCEYFNSIEGPGRPGRMLFLGNLQSLPNQDAVRYFAASVLPRIVKSCPEAFLDVVGKDPPRWMLELSATLPVRVHANVADVRPYARDCSVFLVPLRTGSGTRLKILEAMAMGRPVVSTPIGAEGLGAEHGRHLLVGADDGDFADCVVRLLGSPGARREISARAREFACGRFDWGILAPRLDASYALARGRFNAGASPWRRAAAPGGSP